MTDVAYSPEKLIPERTPGEGLDLRAAPGALRQALALGAADLAVLLLRAAAVLLLLSPLLIVALLIFH
ncbi:hypothetical protein [Siccirubricoccus phaeus]|uniref:hypothetical protein n=1 Tax=Siccirubricoccus phaeus TaxID=2595053 RepID=UPI0011F109F6|nr:hypothetical protein [Siccirubricoccus phaeus]